MTSWKRDFASGLVVLLPILVTLYVVYWLFSLVAGLPGPLQSLAPSIRVAITLVVFVLLVFSVGYLMRTAVGGILEGAIDDVINHLPGFRVIYNASKMAIETALTGAEGLQKPVKVSIWGNMRMTAFKTGKQTSDGREILFLPTAPNITTGFVIEVKQDEYIETGESVEDALTRVLSAGFGETEKDVPPGIFEQSNPGDSSTGSDTD